MVKNPLKILVDEMDDGMDEKLAKIGFEAYSVKKLRAVVLNLHTDFSENCVLDTLTRMTTDIPCDD